MVLDYKLAWHGMVWHQTNHYGVGLQVVWHDIKPIIVVLDYKLAWHGMA